MPKYIDVEKLKLEADENGVLNGVLIVGGGSGKMKGTVMAALRTMIENAPEEAVELVVHCQDCIIKRAVQRKDGLVWRCPHRTGDVKMEGYCESGVRG